MKAIFLDIDGVLQPGTNQKRFEHMAEISNLAKIGRASCRERV